MFWFYTIPSIIHLETESYYVLYNTILHSMDGIYIQTMPNVDQHYMTNKCISQQIEFLDQCTLQAFNQLTAIPAYCWASVADCG